jgi:hypothetical protein
MSFLLIGLLGTVISKLNDQVFGRTDDIGMAVGMAVGLTVGLAVGLTDGLTVG